MHFFSSPIDARNFLCGGKANGPVIGRCRWWRPLMPMSGDTFLIIGITSFRRCSWHFRRRFPHRRGNSIRNRCNMAVILVSYQNDTAQVKDKNARTSLQQSQSPASSLTRLSLPRTTSSNTKATPSFLSASTEKSALIVLLRQF